MDGSMNKRRRGQTDPAPPVPFKYDKGIKRAVEILQAGGIETFQSCEGGKGHAFPLPSVEFYGEPEAGWRAVAICLAHGLPIRQLLRVWKVLDAHEPNGPYWRVEFRERVY